MGTYGRKSRSVHDIYDLFCFVVLFLFSLIYYPFSIGGGGGGGGTCP